MDSYDIIRTAQEVDKVCHGFLRPRKFSYFQFKRIYINDSFIILANNPEFFTDFLGKDFIGISQHISYHTRQSFIYSWDESLSPAILSLTRENMGIFHGITVVSRRKKFYDCTTFAMSERHPLPFSYYFHVLKELQRFAEIFPTMARSLVEKAKEKSIKTLEPQHALNRKSLFLPKRSSRFLIREGVNDYITTYEALCVQLLQEGKSYKEIGSILSMGPGTVETHLTRLKARTGLTLQELSLQDFQSYIKEKALLT